MVHLYRFRYRLNTIHTQPFVQATDDNFCIVNSDTAGSISLPVVFLGLQRVNAKFPPPRLHSCNVGPGLQ